MKNRILFIFVLILLLIPIFKVSANETCFLGGYSVFTINGILNNEIDAIKNKDKLKSKFGTTYNNEPLIFDYLYNPTHLAGAKDLVDTIIQDLVNPTSDYDLIEMLNDASQKVTTQKLLLIGHSQGNFYANSFYKKVAGEIGGIPKESIRVYAVATPTNNVAGVYVPSEKDYTTSDTDKVTKNVTGGLFSFNTLPANVHIDLQIGDDYWGHDFAKVYLKYQGDKIISDIQSSLNQLQTNNIQDLQQPCISSPKLSIAHKITGGILAIADPTANFTKTIAITTALTSYKIALALGNSVIKGANITASAVLSLASLLSGSSTLVVDNSAAAILAVNQSTDIFQETTETSAPEILPIVEEEIVPPVLEPKKEIPSTRPAKETFPMIVELTAPMSNLPSPEVPQESLQQADNIGTMTTVSTDGNLGTGTDYSGLLLGGGGRSAADLLAANVASEAISEKITVLPEILPATEETIPPAEEIISSVIAPASPTVLLGHMNNGVFYFDTPSSLSNYTKTIYRGHYPNTSSPYISMNMQTGPVSFQTISCGWICGSKDGEYYYFDFQSDEGHYIFETHRIGTEWQWETIDPFSIIVFSSLKAITAFDFTSLTPNSTGIINENDYTINLSVPKGTDVTALAPIISISPYASISPNNYTTQNFTNPITYTVTAEDGSTQNYIVTTIVSE